MAHRDLAITRSRRSERPAVARAALVGAVLACSGSARDVTPTTTSEPATPTDAAPMSPEKPPEAGKPPGETPAAPEAADDSGPCDTLTRGACLGSRRCTLVVNPTKAGQYSCRAEQPPCEVGIAQRALSQKKDAAEAARCTERAGCQVDPGSCYCPCGGPSEDEKNCSCACGGGAPPNCVAGPVEKRGARAPLF